ncbi:MULTISPECIES: biofilm peroxide resistance protein BsmA [unclassified Brenneria]|uniref:biofilm peroxide resistance protein BsmA n=1 Tax=unclassified Brenneria TaxID=2634434 RepID=UPI001557BD01|nr:biofilm peroxide resistance protein BsmA [Brenneria sp. hezel4-2-4]MEE3652306.1 biofilm peroxide resistance protein BsmA [Brenneria sp. HEZEL_4_2_4]NPD02263.1 biofilm peroxide resistance protein BsmA [Brenneria sp. hezel4-2-4]
MLKALPAMIFSLFVTACGTLSGAPLPPPTEQAQLINYAQTAALKKIGTVSVTVCGSPDDADRAIQRRADEKGARYYTIVMKSEKTTLPGTWFSRAVLYR